MTARTFTLEATHANAASHTTRMDHIPTCELFPGDLIAGYSGTYRWSRPTLGADTPTLTVFFDDDGMNRADIIPVGTALTVTRPRPRPTAAFAHAAARAMAASVGRSFATPVPADHPGLAAACADVVGKFLVSAVAMADMVGEGHTCPLEPLASVALDAARARRPITADDAAARVETDPLCPVADVAELVIDAIDAMPRTLAAPLPDPARHVASQLRFAAADMHRRPLAAALADPEALGDALSASVRGRDGFGSADVYAGTARALSACVPGGVWSVVPH